MMGGWRRRHHSKPGPRLSILPDLKNGEQTPKDFREGQDDLTHEKLLKLPTHIPHRPKKDPRELQIIDPACGRGHFLLYCLDVLQTIYAEAYDECPGSRPFAKEGLSKRRPSGESDARPNFEPEPA